MREKEGVQERGERSGVEDIVSTFLTSYRRLSQIVSVCSICARKLSKSAKFFKSSGIGSKADKEKEENLVPVQFTCKLVTDDAGGDESMLVDEIKSSRIRSL